MTKFIEFGLGNRWLVRTEFEQSDGTEWEVRGISGKIKAESYYLRLWLAKTVFIWDSQDGIKKKSKSRSAFKLIFGIKSKV